MAVKEELLALIIDAKRTDPETGSFAEYLADFLVANGVTFATENNVGRKWIPVAERLPEAAGEYIVKVSYASAATALWYDPQEDVWFGDDDWDAYPVTHWMPMPGLPKGE